MPPKPPGSAAKVAPEVNQAHKQSKAERVVGRSEANSNDGSMVSDEDIVPEICLVIEGQVDTFVQSSQTLMRVLDELTKIHPFIQVVVGLFKVGVQLELNRRENDKRVIALNTKMCDMMEVLTLLKDVEDPKSVVQGSTVTDRLKRRLAAMETSIRHCARVCDSYQKQHILAKVFTSPKWEGQFTQIAQQFIDLRTALHQDLQIYIFKGIRKLDEDIRVNGLIMKTIFMRMQSPEEREIYSSLVSNYGGDEEAALKDDRMLEGMLKWKGGSQDERRVAKGQGDADEDHWPAMTVEELKQEISKDIQQILNDNQQFEQKFEIAIRKQAEEMKDTIERASERVINTLGKGPHKRIKDQNISRVWEDMGWRGSVKAKHLAMALRDYFVDSCAGGALAAIRDITSNQDSSASQKLGKIEDIANRANATVPVPEEDRWTLDYITVHRVQPLIEALDADASSFVSVNEVNAFTDARPPDWSLSRWIAYWTYGFEMTAQWYFRRIRKVFAVIDDISKAALPSNIHPISRFINSSEVYITQDILSGLQDVEIWDGVDFEAHHVFSRFKNYVVDTETRMEDSLRGVKYCLDDANTLAIVAGKGRPETFVLPLVFLLMRRALWIIKEAAHVTLHDRELKVISLSLSKVLDAVRDRLRTLRAMYKLQNQDEKDQLSKFFYGLYRYVLKDAEFGPYWRRNQLRDMHQIRENVTIHGDNVDGPVPLVYGPQIEDLVLLANQALASKAPVPSSNVPHSLLGPWSGSFTYGDRDWGRALFELSISTHAGGGGGINGSDIDALGPFKVTGTLDGNKMKFFKEYMNPQGGHKLVWWYEGVLDQRQERITGNVMWRCCDDDSRSVSSEGASSDDANRAFDDSNPDGMDVGSAPRAASSSLESSTATPLSSGDFTLKRGPLEFPGRRIMAESLRRILTNLVADAEDSSPLRWDWSGEEPNLGRQRLSELVRYTKRHLEDSTETEDLDIWAELMKDRDIGLRRCLEVFEARRDCPQSFSCDSCGTSSSFFNDLETSVSRTRYMCIDCSKDQVDDCIDLCSKCFIDNRHVPVNRGDSTLHSPTHNMLQLRLARLRVYQFSLLSRGMSGLQRASRAVDNGLKVFKLTNSSVGPSCIDCKGQIKGPPYWYCVECYHRNWDSTFVCCECNNRIETEKPWLTALVTNTNAHDWSHALVSVPNPDIHAQSDKASKSSTEELLARLEEKLNQRLEAMEKLLERLPSV